MAASETAFPHSHFSSSSNNNNNNNNIYPSFPHLFEEISAVLSHGSISFGRYADDSSAWDKRSIFTNNRCQEEVEKFKAPGSVAQKKAYFDEFYKVRALKALSAHQQETDQYGPSQETKENAKLIGNINNVAIEEKENKPSNVSQIHISDSQGILKHKEPSSHEVKSCSTGNKDATIKGGMEICTNIAEVENSFEVAAVSYPPLPEGNPIPVQRKSIASNKVKKTINEIKKHDNILKDKVKKHGNILKDKGTVASVITNKAKVRSLTTKDAVMKSKPTPPLHQQASVNVNRSVPPLKQSTPNAVRNSVKVNKSEPAMKEGTPNAVRNSIKINKSDPAMKQGTPNAVRNSVKVNKSDTAMKQGTPNTVRNSVRVNKSGPAMKESTPNATRNSVKVNKKDPSVKESTPNPVRNISRKTTEPDSSLPRLSRASKSGTLVPSSSSSSIRKTEAMPCLKRSKKETELPAQNPNGQVTKLVSSVSSSSIKKAEANPSSNLQQSRTKLGTRSPSLSRSSKSASENIAITDDLKSKAHCRWGSSDSSGHCMKLGGEKSMDPSPKVISKSRLAQEKPNHGIGVEQNQSYNKERKGEERKDKVQAGLRRDSKQASTHLSGTNRASVRKLVDKVVPLESASLNCDRAAQTGGKSASGQKKPMGW